MVTKLDRMLCSLALVIIPPFANAELPFSAQSLANIQATIDFCGKAEPGPAAKYQEQMTNLVKTLPESEVTAVLNSDDYKSMYDAATTSLGMLGEREAHETCQRLLHPKK